MNKEVVKIIKENEELIDANRWHEIYRILMEDVVDYEIRGAFTAAMLSVGINPLEYLGFIPAGFLYFSTITDIHIPSHIRSIGSYAFRNSDLEKITFEKGSQLTSIGDYAFEYVDNLKSIVIPSSVTSIGWNAFYGSKKLTIYCEAESQPAGWPDNWNRSNNKVVWGYKEE